MKSILFFFHAIRYTRDNRGANYEYGGERISIIHNNIKIRLIEIFLSSTIGNMIFPFMSIYISGHLNPKLVSVLLITNVILGIAASLLGGYIGDRFGRKRLIAAAEGVRCIAFAVMAVWNSPDLTIPEVTLGMLVIHAVCSGMVGPANQAMLIDVSTPEQRKGIYSMVYWINNLSIAIGSLIGAFMFREHLFELLLALVITSFIIWLLIVVLIQDPYKPPVKEQGTAGRHLRLMLSSYKDVFADRTFILFVVSTALVLSMEFHLSHYIGMRLAGEMPEQRLLWWNIGGIEMTGILRTENTILVVALALFAAQTLRRRNERTILWLSWIVFVGSYAVISYTTQAWLLVLMMVVASLAEVVRVPIEQSYFASLPPEHARSSYLAVSSLKHNLTLLICSVTVFISTYVPDIVTTLLITLTGTAGIFMFMRIMPAFDQRPAAGYTSSQ